MTNYPYRWFTNIAGLLEKRTYSAANIFLFALFVGSFRRFLEWTIGGVPEPFPLSFIVTLTGFYWLAFFLITLLLRFLVDQPWRVSINVILVGIFLGIFPPILDLLITGPGFEYAYVWSLPSSFHWYLYNPALNIPAGEAIVLWAVILLSALYVWHRTHSALRAFAALAGAYAAVLVLGGAAAGTAKAIRLFMGWEPTQQIALVNLLQPLVALGAYLGMQPALGRSLARRLPQVFLPVALCLAGAFAAGGVWSPSVAIYAGFLVILLLLQQDVGPGADAEDVLFLTLTAALLLAALTAANSFSLLPLAVIFAAGLLKRQGLSGERWVAVASFVAAFAVGLTAAVEQAAYGAPRWWISFLPAPAASGATGPLSLTALGALALLAVAATIYFSRRPGVSRETAYTTFGVLCLVAFAAGVRVFLDWALLARYPTRMLMTLLVVTGRYWLTLFLFVTGPALFAGIPWRMGVAHARRFLWLGLIPPLFDGFLGAGGNLLDTAWTLPAGISWRIAYPDQGVTLGETVIWWTLVALSGVWVWRTTRSGLRSAAAVAWGYLAASVAAMGPAALAELARSAAGWPSEHRLMLLAIVQTVSIFAVYLVLQPGVRRGLARRIPHVLPFFLIVFLGSAFYGGAITLTTVVYAFLLVFAGWAALGQNDYFDAGGDAAQGRISYLDLEDVRFLTTISWFGVAGLAAAHAGVTFLAVMAVVTYMLYNYPFYRGKRYFPTNLKIEGVWGLCAFMFGVVAAFEHTAYGAPRWWFTHSPPLEPALQGPFPVPTIAAMFLAFGGFSLVALLKDYKDTEADLADGVQTLYTVALKRGRPLAGVHAVALGLCCLAIASAPFLMAAAGKASWNAGAGGITAAAVVWPLLSGEPSAGRFRAALVVLAAYFTFLIGALLAHAA